MKKAIHVCPDADGWFVRTAGCPRKAKKCATQQEAIQVGRRMAVNKRTTLIVHRQDGSVRSMDTFPEPKLFSRASRDK